MILQHITPLSFSITSYLMTYDHECKYIHTHTDFIDYGMEPMDNIGNNGHICDTDILPISVGYLF